MTISWGAVCRPKQGQTTSGDVYVIQEYGQNHLLVSVIDGLGGGTEAAHAAELAAVILREYPERPLSELIQRSHTALRGTRGAVASLLRLDLQNRQATYVGVGNIGVHVYSRQSIKPISKNGILGYRLPSLLELRYAYDTGDLFVLYSDGVSNKFPQDGQIDIRVPSQSIAEQILNTHGKHSDDATVVVINTAISL